jgi:hypothetical protein
VLPFLKNETDLFYDIEFYLPQIDYNSHEIKIDFTHKITQENNSLVILFKFPELDLGYIPYGCIAFEVFEDSETIIFFDMCVSSESEIIIKECHANEVNQIIIRVFKSNICRHKITKLP